VSAVTGFSVGYNGCHWNQLLVLGSNVTIRSAGVGDPALVTAAPTSTPLCSQERDVVGLGWLDHRRVHRTERLQQHNDHCPGESDLTNHSTIYVGYNGAAANASFNSLIISNGGRFTTQAGKILEVGDTVSSNNLVRITGSNSLWDAKSGAASIGVRQCHPQPDDRGAERDGLECRRHRRRRYLHVREHADDHEWRPVVRGFGGRGDRGYNGTNNVPW